MTFEARDYGVSGPYASGLSFGYDGRALRMGEREIAEVPPGTWADVEVRIGLTGGFAGRWSVSAGPRGGVRRTVTFDRFADVRFRNLTWLGFMSYAPDDSIWQLDDFQLLSE